MRPSFKDIVLGVRDDPEKQALVSYSFAGQMKTVVLPLRRDGFGCKAEDLIQFALNHLRPGLQKQHFCLKELHGRRFLDPSLTLSEQGIDQHSSLAIMPNAFRNPLAGGKPKVKPSIGPPRSSIPCADYKHGNCARAPCDFSHAAAGVLPPKVPVVAKAAAEPAACFAFKQGTCTRGSLCKYLHAATNLSPSTSCPIGGAPGQNLGSITLNQKPQVTVTKVPIDNFVGNQRKRAKKMAKDARRKQRRISVGDDTDSESDPDNNFLTPTPCLLPGVEIKQPTLQLPTPSTNVTTAPTPAATTGEGDLSKEELATLYSLLRRLPSSSQGAATAQFLSLPLSLFAPPATAPSQGSLTLASLPPANLLTSEASFVPTTSNSVTTFLPPTPASSTPSVAPTFNSLTTFLPTNPPTTFLPSTSPSLTPLAPLTSTSSAPAVLLSSTSPTLSLLEEMGLPSDTTQAAEPSLSPKSYAIPPKPAALNPKLLAKRAQLGHLECREFRDRGKCSRRNACAYSHGPIPIKPSFRPTPPQDPSPLELLEEMGFGDEDQNRELLRDLNNDPVLVIARYLDEERSMGLAWAKLSDKEKAFNIFDDE
jgi:hypothetical protein